jgi:tetratricopeptide (TPR) repeat protein
MKRLSVVCLVGTVAICFPKSLPAQGNAETAKLARQGSEAAKNKDWDGAVDAYRKAAERDKKNTANLAAVLQQRAVAAVGQNRFADALADFTEALTITPNDAGILERRAYVEMKMNDYDKALADYSEAIKLKPNDVRYYNLRGYIYEVKGDIKNSMADTDHALKLQKGNAEAKARKERLQKIEAQNAANQQPVPPPPPAPKKP